jgi:hypothetical protein
MCMNITRLQGLELHMKGEWNHYETGHNGLILILGLRCIHHYLEEDHTGLKW